MSLANPLLAVDATAGSAPERSARSGATAPAQPEAEPAGPLSARFLAWTLGFWTLMGVIESLKSFVMTRLDGRSFTLFVAFGQNMPWWLIWGLFTPLAFWLAHRFDITGQRRVRAALAHVGFGLILSLVHIWLTALLFVPLIQRPEIAATMTVARFTTNLMNQYILMDLLTYAMIVAVYQGAAHYQAMRRRELEAVRLRAVASDARLHALAMQLNPHFLFNTLNSVAGLIRRGDSTGSLGMLASLGDMLRETLAAGAAPTVPLREELALLRLYLDIEAVRFRDRLRVEYNIDPAVMELQVPRLMLQPLAENAVRHGIAAEPGGGSIAVAAHRIAGGLEIVVSNRSATGARVEPPTREGIGLSNVRERLSELYGTGGSLTLAFPAAGGCDARIMLPDGSRT